MPRSEDGSPLLHSNPAKPSSRLPILFPLRSSKSFILITICLALFTDSFIYGALVPVLPFLLENRYHVRTDDAQLWTSILFSVFGLAILVASPLCGWFADVSLSRRLPLLLSLPVLACGTILVGIGENVWILFTSRLLQGVSTAVAWIVVLALVRDTAGVDEVGQWMGTTMAASSIGLVVSPFLGGLAFDLSGTWGVVTMMMLLIIVDSVLVISLIEKRVALHLLAVDDHAAERNTTYGSLAESALEQNLVAHGRYGVNGGVSDSFGSASLNGSNASLASTDIGVADERVSYNRAKPYKYPIIMLLKSPRVLTCVYGVFTQFGILAAFDAFLPLFVERHFGWGSFGAGLIFLNVAVPALGGPLVGKLSDRYGPRYVALFGCSMVAPPLFLLRLIGYEGDIGQIVSFCVLLIAAGVFLTFIISPLAADLSFAVDFMEAKNPGVFGEKGAYAQVYALFNCSMAISLVVGPLIAGSLQDRYGVEGVSLVMGLWPISAAILVLFFVGDDVKERGADSGFAGRTNGNNATIPSCHHSYDTS